MVLAILFFNFLSLSEFLSRTGSNLRLFCCAPYLLANTCCYTIASRECVFSCVMMIVMLMSGYIWQLYNFSQSYVAFSLYVFCQLVNTHFYLLGCLSLSAEAVIIFFLFHKLFFLLSFDRPQIIISDFSLGQLSLTGFILFLRFLCKLLFCK